MPSADEAELSKDPQSSNVEEKDKKKELLMAKKRMLEQEERALRAASHRLRAQERNLMIENERLKAVLVYRNKVRSGELPGAEVAEDESSRGPTDLNVS